MFYLKLQYQKSNKRNHPQTTTRSCVKFNRSAANRHHTLMRNTCHVNTMLAADMLVNLSAVNKMQMVLLKSQTLQKSTASGGSYCVLLVKRGGEWTRRQKELRPSKQSLSMGNSAITHVRVMRENDYIHNFPSPVSLPFTLLPYRGGTN